MNVDIQMKADFIREMASSPTLKALAKRLDEEDLKSVFELAYLSGYLRCAAFIKGMDHA